MRVTLSCASALEAPAAQLAGAGGYRPALGTHLQQRLRDVVLINRPQAEVHDRALHQRHRQVSHELVPMPRGVALDALLLGRVHLLG
jgi:hypothetical protein